ncbi:hypothetical protein SAMN05216570_1119 [Dyella sp. OK004]|uniref:hypothetical protein n=1 Tax=Dyella sp. OK004 TaxID=1855292 RepID=UPI0008E80502|nr:hypothetical protein [Dyella sp. OK004]SFR95080.1 hypothetical protein SAMN05216570_1119 [Dyella sp. OK004]
MKALFAALLIAGVMHNAPALARTSSASPLIGRWTVDVSRLPMPPEARPKSATIAFADAGEGKWTTHVDIVDAGGGESHAVGTTALDGTAAPVQGSPEADTVALKSPAPNVLVMALAREGVPASTRVYAVAADGKSLVETAVYFGDNGLPIMRTHYFTRVR